MTGEFKLAWRTDRGTGATACTGPRDGLKWPHPRVLELALRDRKPRRSSRLAVLADGSVPSGAVNGAGARHPTARVSTTVQDLALQLDVLHAAGCAAMFRETRSGAARGNDQLDEVFEASAEEIKAPSAAQRFTHQNLTIAT